MDISSLTLRSAADALARRDVSSVELTQSMLDAIAARDADIGAYLTVDAEGALAQARAADAARAGGATGDLLGVPVAIKDIINVTGQPCTCASKILVGYTAPFDATVTARLRAAGAVFAGGRRGRDRGRAKVERALRRGRDGRGKERGPAPLRQAPGIPSCAR